MSVDLTHDTRAGLRQALDYWNRKSSESSTDCERVEQNRRPQRMRYEAFLLGHDLAGMSILDVGCGAGDFWDHLQQRDLDCEYVGFDLSPGMIDRCRARFPGVRFESGVLLEWDPHRQFDYTTAFGVHNIKVDGSWESLRETTRRQFELCNHAAHISILTDRYSGFAPHIQAWRAEEVLTMALELTPFVVLRHDYLPNDFSITLYRQPLIDTRADLVPPEVS